MCHTRVVAEHQGARVRGTSRKHTQPSSSSTLYLIIHALSAVRAWRLYVRAALQYSCPQLGRHFYPGWLGLVSVWLGLSVAWFPCGCCSVLSHGLLAVLSGCAAAGFTCSGAVVATTYFCAVTVAVRVIQCFVSHARRSLAQSSHTARAAQPLTR